MVRRPVGGKLRRLIRYSFRHGVRRIGFAFFYAFSCGLARRRFAQARQQGFHV
ncbi:Uncharacterised protein [Bordetella pertussis]|nr:Uncharacterised protein [Bordetella pertussis]